MLKKGERTPQFEVTTVDGRRVTYSTIWQRKQLVLVVLPRAKGDDYANALLAQLPAFAGHDTECVVTREPVEGIAAPGVLIADRWGEVVHAEAVRTIEELPPADDLLDWAEHVQHRCPECEGEAK